MHAKIYDRTGQQVVFDLKVKPQTNGFHEFILLFSILLQIDRLQLTAVYCNRRECKDNTSKDPFSQCEQLQGIHNTKAERQAQQHVLCSRKPEACEHARVHQLKTRECPLFVCL